MLPEITHLGNCVPFQDEHSPKYPKTLTRRSQSKPDSENERIHSTAPYTGLPKFKI